MTLDRDPEVPAASAEGKLLRSGNRTHAGQRGERRHELADHALSSVVAAGVGQHHVEHRDAAGVDTGVDGAHPRDAAHEEAGAPGENHRQRDLRDDDPALESSA